MTTRVLLLLSVMILRGGILRAAALMFIFLCLLAFYSLIH